MHDERQRCLAEIEALRRRAERLEERLAASGKGFCAPVVCLLVGLALGAGFTWHHPEALGQVSTGPLPMPTHQPGAPVAPGQPGQPARDIVCSSVKIVGPDGKVRVTLGVDTISGFVQVHGPDGKSRAALWLDNSNKYGLLTLMDENGKNRVVVGGNDSGGACTIQDKDGKNHVYIGSATNPSGGLVRLFGPQGKAVVEVGMNQDAGLVHVNGHDGQLRAALWTFKGGQDGVVNLCNAAGKRLVSLGTDAHGGALDLKGINDIRQVALDCHNQWGGGLNLYTSQGKQLIYLAANTNNGHGLFKLCGWDGLSRVQMFVDNGGVGAVQGNNAAGQVIRWLK